MEQSASNRFQPLKMQSLELFQAFSFETGHFGPSKWPV